MFEYNAFLNSRTKNISSCRVKIPLCCVHRGVTYAGVKTKVRTYTQFYSAYPVLKTLPRLKIMCVNTYLLPNHTQLVNE